MGNRNSNHAWGQRWKAEQGQPPVAALTEEEYRALRAQQEAERLANIARIEAQRTAKLAAQV